jgi:mannose-1-phosphate guanylyltransferase
MRDRKPPPDRAYRQNGRPMYAVILAGGGGTRLWPLSRQARPKPFLPLLGPESLFQATLGRISPLIKPEDVYVVAAHSHLPLAREQAPWLKPHQLLGEPVGRNTAAAIALAALAIDRPADDVMVVLPADHVVEDGEAFRAGLAMAADAADPKTLVTLGITPTGPATGYGYIVATDADTTAAARKVERFVEKPSRERAEELLRHPNGTWWNAGIFIWRRDRILHVLEHHAGQVFGPLRAGLADLATVYPRLPSISIDYAVMEPVAEEGKVKVVPVECGWSDVGDWRALRAELAGRPGQVVSVGRADDLGSSDVLVHSSGGRLVVTIGLRDMIVVDTPDVVLVCDADRTQEVRKIVEQLAAANDTDHL